MAVRKKVEEVAHEVKDYAMEVHEEFEGEIDPYLVRWAKSPVSGWIACGFGVALLAIGAVLGVVLS